MPGTRTRLKALVASTGMAASLVGVVMFAATSSNAAVASTTPNVSPAEAGPQRDVVLVGNSVAGTVSFLDGHTFANLGSLNVIPDLAERLAAMNPTERTGYEIVRSQEGG